MPVRANRLIFSLENIQQLARHILEMNLDGVLAYRLLREVLRLPPENTALRQARESAMSSKWVRQLEETQLADGSWGRFHSQDTRKKTVFRTTEEAIDRAFALGLRPDHQVLWRARQYIQDVLNGNKQITDRVEKNEAFPVFIRFILAGRLAQIDPANRLLYSFRDYLGKVADQAFSSGKYSLEGELTAYRQLSGIHAPRGFLESQHALYILSTRPLSGQLEQALLDWVWKKPDGIGYLRARLSSPQPQRIGYWLRSMNIVCRFSCWREMCAHTLNQLWNERDGAGLWDFGSHSRGNIDFPLSESRQKSLWRKLDHTTCLLVILRRYFD